MKICWTFSSEIEKSFIVENFLAFSFMDQTTMRLDEAWGTDLCRWANRCFTVATFTVGMVASCILMDRAFRDSSGSPTIKIGSVSPT